MSRCTIHLMGAPHILKRGKRYVLKRTKTQLLLAYLALEQRLQAREKLAELLWPDLPPTQGRKLLRQAVYELRLMLGSTALGGDRNHIVLSQHVVEHVDIFQATSYLQRLTYGGEKRVQETEFVAWQRPFLDGLSFAECEVLEQWAYAVKERLRSQCCRLCGDCVSQFRKRGEREAALAIVALWRQVDSLDEALYSHWMTLLCEQGDTVAALRVFHDYEQRLNVDLGLLPSSALRQQRDVIRDNQCHPAVAIAPPSPSLPDTRYLNSEGVYIAYQLFGAGTSLLCIIPGFISQLEQVWENPLLADFLETLAKHTRILLFDKRGTGMSDRLPHAATVEEIVTDVVRLLDQLAVDKCIVFGYSDGGAAAIQLAATYPERVSSLILFGAAAVWLNLDGKTPALSEAQYGYWQDQLIRNWGTSGSIDQFAPSQVHDPVVRQWWGKMLRLSVSPGDVGKVLERIRQTDVRAHLVNVKCPVAVLHKAGDRVVRMPAAHWLAEQLTQSRKVVLPGVDHWFWTEQPSLVLQAILENAVTH